MGIMNILILPNDIFRVIINLIPSTDYYNIYRISSKFRSCLKLVYDSDIVLRKNSDNDILSYIVYGYKDITDDKIYKAICNYHEKFDFYTIKPEYTNLLLYFDVEYNNRLLPHIMQDACVYINVNITLIKHLEKSNNITKYYTSLLKNAKYNNHTEVYNYIFEKLVNCNDAYQISIMTISVLNNGEINLAERLISTGLAICETMSILPILIKLNNLSMVQIILNGVNKLKQCRYKTLCRNIRSDEMKNCIDTYFGK